MTEPAPIPSQLVRAALLGTASTYLRHMVQAATWQTSVPYSEGLLRHVACDPTVTSAVRLMPGQDVDAALLDAMLAHPDDVDAVILAAVRSYTQPTTP